MKKNTKQPVRKDTETLVDTLGLGMSHASGFGLNNTPNQLSSVMDTQPSPADRIEMKK